MKRCESYCRLYFNPLTPGGVRRSKAAQGKIIQRHFNPLTPGGVRRADIRPQQIWCRFQSTHPGWGETDLLHCHQSQILFQSTHPGWGETKSIAVARQILGFQSTHPGWGETEHYQKHGFQYFDFNPLTPGGVRRYKELIHYAGYLISIHSPRVG